MGREDMHIRKPLFTRNNKKIFNSNTMLTQTIIPRLYNILIITIMYTIMHLIHCYGLRIRKIYIRIILSL